MGDQITEAGDRATVVPPSEASRLLGVEGHRDEVTSAFATLCRINALGMIHLAGSGHIGSSFSSLDVTSFLLLEHLQDDDVYFSSKGHDVPGYYAALLALGRLEWDLVARLRRLDGLPGHPDVRTPGIAFNTGSLGMGISKAKGLVKADRLAGRRRRVVVMTGDGELQEGQIWESLATAVRDAMSELTIVVDHNRLQSDLAIAAVSDLGVIEEKFAAFGWHAERVDGHDFSQLRDAFADVGEGPRAIIAETVKGAGVSFTEHTAQPTDQRFYPFHSGALPDELYTNARDELVARLHRQFAELGLDAPTLEELDRLPSGFAAPTALPAPGTPHHLVNAYGRALVQAGRRRSDLVVLDADLMVDCGLVEFADTFPDRFIECGIAEQDMVSQAGGLAAGGMLPVVNSFAAFLSQRPSEQVANNAGEDRKIIYMGSLAGLIPAGPGHSHQATRDIASFGSVSDVTVIAPATEQQVADAVTYATGDTAESVYLRLCAIPVELPFDDAGLPPSGQGSSVLTGDGTMTIVAYGPVLLTEAYAAITSDRDLLDTVGLVNLPWLSKLDRAWVRDLCASTRAIVVLDDHDVRGGLGERLAAIIAGFEDGPPVTILGIDGLPAGGQRDETLAAHGLDRTSLAGRLADIQREVGPAPLAVSGGGRSADEQRP